MKRLSVWLLAALVILGATLRAELPDDQFVRVYNLIQQADNYLAHEQPRAAAGKYLEAQAVLEQLQASYPSWNEKIVKYRKDYIAEKLKALGAAGAMPPVELAKPAAQTTPAVDPAAALAEELKSTRAERDLLRAKLQEALAVQPAGSDPRELAKAQERIQALQKELETLKAAAAQPPEKDPSAEALASARKELKDLKQTVEKLKEELADAGKQKAAAEQKLKKELEKAASRPSGEKEALELASKAQAETVKLKAELDVMKTEKAALEQKLAAPTAVRPTPQAAPSRSSRREDKARIEMLENERDELKKQVNLLTKQLEDRKVRKAGAVGDTTVEQLAIARARLEVYEARKVPYTPEELALMKGGALTSAKPEAKSGKKAGREVSTAAAVLLTEAQRAFDAQRYADAEKKFQQALKIEEKNVGIMCDLAATLLQLDKLAEAETVLKGATDLEPNRPQALSLTGLLRFKQQKYEDALTALSQAAQLDPDDAITQNYLGITLSQKGQNGPAETAFRRAVQLQPNYTEAHYNLAVAYATQNPPYLELARWHYQKALAGGHPQSPDMEKLLEEKKP